MFEAAACHVFAARRAFLRYAATMAMATDCYYLPRFDYAAAIDAANVVTDNISALLLSLLLPLRYAMLCCLAMPPCCRFCLRHIRQPARCCCRCRHFRCFSPLVADAFDIRHTIARVSP